MIIDQDTSGVSAASGSGGGFLSGEVIVRLSDSGLSREAIDALRASVGAELVSSTQKWGFELWQFDGVATDVAIEQLHASGVADYAEYVQANYVLTAADFEAEATIPTDPQFGSLWGLNNTGQSNGTVDADIDAPEAWDVSTGAGVVVAVIDSGVDYNHPDLMNQMWINTGEIAGNGIDDDNNGFVDDYYGYDFANDDGDPWDDDSHGTHVAGTIAAQANNGTGVTGVAYNANIMALKFLDASGSGSTFDAIRAVEYATLMGADITNNSWGGGGYSQALYDAIELSGQAGSLFVAAAGNGGADQIGDNNDALPHYPSNYDLSNLISVAATDRNDNLTSFSNFGATSVDLAAPGSSILSTVPGGGYAWFNGTSMATPHVSGVAALLLASEPGLTPEQVKDRILDSVDPLPGLSGITVSGGRLNAANTLAPPQPGSISGTVWDDADSDGIQDAGEVGLSGWTVFLDVNQNGSLDGGEATATTNGSGVYTFSGVAPGSYQVQQVVQSGWTQTAPLFTGNYAYTDSNSGGPAYNWFDISGVGTQLTLTDDSSATVSLPFAFDFFGQTETSVKISSNSYLTFGTDGSDYSNDAIPNVSDPDAIIAPFWDDLNPENGGNIYHYHDAANSRFIVEYDGIQPYSGSGNYTFQAILNADGSIQFQYQSMTGTLNSATIGIENHAGNGGLQVAYNTNYAQNGLAVLIDDAAGQPTFNTVNLSSGQAVTGADFGNHNPGGGGGGGGGGNPTDDVFVGGAADNVFDGGGGDDSFLLRYGNDTATGGADADEFKIDGRYINDGDAHTITDLNFGEGDTLVLRFFEPNSFSNSPDPANHLSVGNSGRTATFDSIADIVEGHSHGVMQASDSGDGDTLLSISVAGEEVTVELDGISYASLGIGGGPVDPSPGNDSFIGGGADNTFMGWGGDDSFLLRYGNDTATGGTGADTFKFDGRYVNDGDSHRITDLDFSEGDTLFMRFFEAGTFDNAVDPSNHLSVGNSGGTATFDSVEDILEAHANGVMTAADDGFGGTNLSVTVGGELLTVTLDGWDII
jgi:subtilisin family serine protease